MHEPKIYFDQVTLDQKKESKTIFFFYFNKGDQSLQELFEKKFTTKLCGMGLFHIQNTKIQKRDREEQSSVQGPIYLEYDTIKH